MEKGLGREHALRRLWPSIVGRQLNGKVQLECFRGSHLVVSVPDKEWKKPLESLGEMILGRVNGLWGEKVAGSLEFVVRPGGSDPQGRAAPQRRRKREKIEAVGVPTGTIGNAELRTVFERAASKYFAWQEEKRK
jgi:hypothetical protein